MPGFEWLGGAPQIQRLTDIRGDLMSKHLTQLLHANMLSKDRKQLLQV